MDTSHPHPRDPNDTSMRANVATEHGPYAGLNRKQRRHAMASEKRAARKGLI